MGLYFVRENISLEEEDAVTKACEQVDISIAFEQGEQQVLLNGENVNGLIRSVEAGTMASACSVKGQVRKKLVELQQRLAATENVVMDGRDIGTHVLPNADLKVYLTASSRVRANRRYEELIRKGESVSLEEIEKSIIDRDHRDMNRDISPLCQAKDAILVDSSAMTIKEVATHILNLFYEAKNK